MTPLYIDRMLYTADKKYSEAEILNSPKNIIVLAEPGGGKTELLKSLANKLDVRFCSANSFRYKNGDVGSASLVIDAFDELVRVDTSGVLEILGKASESKADKVIVSSRSSEWNEAWTRCFSDFFGDEPLVVRLFELDESEQQAI